MELGDHMGFLSDAVKGTRHCLARSSERGAALCSGPAGVYVVRRPHFFFLFFFGPGRTVEPYGANSAALPLSLCAPAAPVTSRRKTDAEVREFINFSTLQKPP